MAEDVNVKLSFSVASQQLKEAIKPLRDLNEAFRGLVTAGGIGIALQQAARAIGDMQAAAEKAHPLLRAVPGSLTEWTSSMNTAKQAIGALISGGLSPLRAAIADTTTVWAENILRIQDYAAAIQYLANQKAAQAIKAQVDDLQAQLVKLQGTSVFAYAKAQGITGAGSAELGRQAKTKAQQDLETRIQELQNSIIDLAKTTMDQADRSKQLTDAYKSLQSTLGTLYRTAQNAPALLPQADLTKQMSAAIAAFLQKGFALGFDVTNTPAMKQMYDVFRTMTAAIGDVPVGEVQAALLQLVAAVENNTESIKGTGRSPGSGGSGSRTGKGKNPREKGDAIEDPAMGALASAALQLAQSFTSVQLILDPWSTILKAAVEVLAPFVDSALAPIVGALVVLGKTLGQILIPVVQLLAPIIEALGVVFVWLYNNVLLGFGNAIITLVVTIENIGVALHNFFDWLFNGSKNQQQYKSYKDAFLKPITLEDMTAAGNEATASAGGYGSSTTVQKPPDINVYQTFQQPIYGVNGLREAGKYLVDAIGAYLGTGVRVTFIQPSLT
jgi:hypothetical protein